VFVFSSRIRHTRSKRDWSSDVCSSDLTWKGAKEAGHDFGITCSMVYTRNFSKITGVGMERIPVSFPDWGNIAAEAVPMTLAHHRSEERRVGNACNIETGQMHENRRNDN